MAGLDELVLDEAAMFLTVITCTHNPRPAYLAATVKALAKQTHALDQWEYLLVDNASAPERAPVVDLSWHPHARTIREEQLGLTPARLRGIREARGNLLVFVDDDNVLDEDFLAQAVTAAEERPFLGSWSGQCRPGFDVPPPAWTRRYWGSLVIRNFTQDVWSNLPRLAETMPCGAGLCVRSEVAQHYLAIHESGRRRFQFDRTGDSLVSGGDNDLAACACVLGLGVGLVAALKLTHLIPSERLTVEYLARLADGIQFSSLLLDAEHGLCLPAPTWLGRCADQLRLLRYRGPHRVIRRAVQSGRARAYHELGRGGAIQETCQSTRTSC